MTTTVYVKARAHGAIVTLKTIAEGEVGHNVEDQTFELNSWNEQQFHLEPNQRLEVVQGTPELVARLTEATKPPEVIDATTQVDLTAGAAEAEVLGLSLKPAAEETPPAPEVEKVADDKKKR